jgi:hypothetical protein
MRYADRQFRHETVELGGNQFENCTFTECKLLFSALERVYFTGCVFTQCDWAFDGPAENMLYFLFDLYHGLGPRGHTVVDLIFKGIQEGTFPATPTPTPVLAR